MAAEPRLSVYTVILSDEDCNEVRYAYDHDGARRAAGREPPTLVHQVDLPKGLRIPANAQEGDRVDGEVLRGIGGGYDVDKRCGACRLLECGTGEWDKAHPWQVCRECGRCGECGHDEDCEGPRLDLLAELCEERDALALDLAHTRAIVLGDDQVVVPADSVAALVRKRMAELS